MRASLSRGGYGGMPPRRRPTPRLWGLNCCFVAGVSVAGLVFGVRRKCAVLVVAEIPCGVWADWLAASPTAHRAGEYLCLPRYAPLSVSVVVAALFA